MKSSTRTLIRDLIQYGTSLALAIWFLYVIIQDSYRRGYKQGVIDVAHAVVKHIEDKRNDTNK